MIGFERRQARRADPARALCRALAALLGGSVAGSRSEPWASATFQGARHRITIHVDETASATARAALRLLPDAEFAVPDHLVADCLCVGLFDQGTHLIVTVEALTIEQS